MKDEVIPKDKWEFNSEVTKVFENMLQRSIPQYDIMRDSIVSLIGNFLRPRCNILDLGCSNGLMIEKILRQYGDNHSITGIDISKPMIDDAKKRLNFGVNNYKSVRLFSCDLRNDYPDGVFRVILSVLTLQFTPIEYRLKILSNIYKSLEKGGIFIIIEKVIGDTAEIDDLIVQEYLGLKKRNGYTQEQIDRKRLSLEGVLVPLPADINQSLIRRAGFNSIDCFWRWMNFAGWLAIKS